MLFQKLQKKQSTKKETHEKNIENRMNNVFRKSYAKIKEHQSKINGPLSQINIKSKLPKANVPLRALEDGLQERMYFLLGCVRHSSGKYDLID